MFSLESQINHMPSGSLQNPKIPTFSQFCIWDTLWSFLDRKMEAILPCLKWIIIKFKKARATLQLTSSSEVFRRCLSLFKKKAVKHLTSKLNCNMIKSNERNVISLFFKKPLWKSFTLHVIFSYINRIKVTITLL